VPAEKGIPLDKRVLGAAPHPFGPLEAVKPGMSRDDVIAAVPGMLRDGDKLIIASGIEGVGIELAFDDAGLLAAVTYSLPATAKELLASAWGASIDGGWIDKRRRWRADLYDDGTLAVMPMTLFGDLIGRGPDGLAEKRALIGATLEQLRVWFGARLQEPSDDTEDLQLALAAGTEVCGNRTVLVLELGAAGKVTRLRLQQCVEGDEARRTALAVMEARWGRATPTRTADDRLVFAWQLPGRRLEADEGDAVWEVRITPK